jgi:hypothetical protein
MVQKKEENKKVLKYVIQNGRIYVKEKIWKLEK